MDLGKIKTLVSAILERERTHLVDLEYFSKKAPCVLRLYINKDGGVTSADCKHFVDRVGAVLDTSGIMGQSYILEISSPGADRGSKQDRDFGRISSWSERGNRDFQGDGCQVERAQADPPDMVALHIRLGCMCQQKGLLNKAHAHFRKAAVLSHNRADGHVCWIEHLNDKGHYLKAARYTKRILRTYPEDAYLCYLLGMSYRRAHRYGLMRRYFKLYLKRPSAPQQNPFRRMGVYLCLKEYAQAAQLAESILDERYGSVNFWRFRHIFFYEWSEPPRQMGPPQDFWEPYHEGVRQDYWESLKKWSRLNSRSPWGAFFKIMFLRHLRNGGIDRVGADDVNAALGAEYSSFLPLPESRYAWMNFPRSHDNFKAGRYSEARAAFAKIRNMCPTFLEVHCTLAEALVCLGEIQAARRVIALLLPKMKKSRSIDILTWCGEILLWIGDYQEAYRLLDVALEAGSWLALCWRGAAHFMQGRYDDAEQDFDRAVANRDPEAYLWRGELFRISGKTRKARADLDRAIALGCGDWAYANRALLNAAMGRAAAMRQDFHRIDGDVRNALRARIGLGESAPLSDAQIVRLLETGLRLARGLRRGDAYLRVILLRRCRNGRRRSARIPDFDSSGPTRALSPVGAYSVKPENVVTTFCAARG